MQRRAWQAYLVNLLVWLGIAQGGVVMLAAFYLCNGRWAGTTQYRLAETFAGFIPLGFVLFFGLYFGRTLIFPWVLHPIAQKAAWLNTPFLFARDGIGLAIMTVAQSVAGAALAHQSGHRMAARIRKYPAGSESDSADRARARDLLRDRLHDDRV